MAIEPTTLLNGTTADANEVMDLFDEIYSNIDESNVAAGNKTGSGKFVLQTAPTIASPTITSPVITSGTITSTTITSAILTTAKISGAGVGFATIQYANSATNRTITFPDPGGDDSVVYLAATQSLSNKTLVLPHIDGAGAGDAILQYANSATNRTYTIPDSGAAASFVMTEGAQTINAVKTFSSTITSNVATGTSPLTVASTTKVTNLNADLLDGISSAGFVIQDSINSDNTPSGIALGLVDDAGFVDLDSFVYNVTVPGSYLIFYNFNPLVDWGAGAYSSSTTFDLIDATGGVAITTAFFAYSDNSPGGGGLITNFCMQGVYSFGSTGNKTIKLRKKNTSSINLTTRTVTLESRGMFRIGS